MSRPFQGSSDDDIIFYDGETAINGHGGSDIVVFQGSFAEFGIDTKKTGNLKTSIEGAGQSVEVKSIEFLQFDDGTYDVQTGQFSASEPPPVLPSLSVSDISVIEQFTQIGYEGNPLDGGLDSHPFGGFVPVEFTVTLSEASAVAVTVNYSTSNSFDVDPATTAVPGEDFIITNGAITFTPGQTTATVRVFVADDFSFEADETFELILSDPTNAVIGDATGLATIVNNEPESPALPALSINDISVVEAFTQFGYADNPRDGGLTSNQFGGFVPIQFTVTLSEASAAAVTVDYTTSTSFDVDRATTAVPGEDFIVTNDTIIFAPGQTTATIQVFVSGDFDIEGDETFEVTLSNPTNAAIGDGTGIGAILNNDPEGASFGVQTASSDWLI